MNLFNNLGKSWSKSKTPEEQGQPCHQNNFVNYMQQPQLSALYQPQYQPQPHIHHQPPTQPFHQHHVYQQVHQPIQTIPLSTCPHQCQSHLIQSTHQSVAYQVQQHHNHLRNATLDPRSTDQQQPMVLNNHIQAPMPQQQPTAAAAAAATGAAQQFVQAMPPFHHQTNNHVDSQVSLPTQQSQSRFSDNSYYSNHMAATLTYQQHDQQMHPPQQQQQQQQKLQLDDRQRLQQQQQHQHHHQQQQLQHQMPQHNQQQQQQQQQDQQHRHRQQLVKQQQQYQNHHQAVNDLANSHNDGGLSLETRCLLHEKDNEVLNKMGNCLKENLKNLGEELEKIRRETPKYSVDEVKI